MFLCFKFVFGFRDFNYINNKFIFDNDIMYIEKMFVYFVFFEIFF